MLPDGQLEQVVRQLQRLLTRALAALATTALLACSAPALPPRVEPRLEPVAEPSYVPPLCPRGWPGWVLPLGRQAVFVAPREHYYGLACTHPAAGWANVEQESVEAAVEALAEALAAEGRDLREHSLQILGLLRPPEPNAEPTAHVYVRGDRCATSESWMAPSTARPSCTFDALYDLRSSRIVVLDLDGAPDDSCRPPNDGLFAPENECRFGIGGRVLPFGRGTFLPESAPRVCTHADAEDREHFMPDDESVRLAMRAIEERLAADDRRLDQYWMQALGERVPGDEGASYLYVSGACTPRTLNGWLEECLANVADGGECYFHTHFDLTSRELERFWFHGDA